MKTWKKILIVALSVLAITAATFVGLLVKIHYEKYHQESYWPPQPQHVSKNILMVYGYHGLNEYVQLKDVRTGKFTTPELQHIFINEYCKEDSLVVFRTFDRLRGYLNVNTGQIIIPAQYNRAWNFSEGIAAVLKDGVVSFIKEDGELAFSNTFPIYYDDDYSEIAFQFHQGLCVMRTLDNKWGLINTRGEWVVEPVYNSIDAPHFGYRRVTDCNKYGLLTLDGKVALPLEYDNIRLSSDDRGFILIKAGLAKEVDKDLQTIVPFVYDNLSAITDDTYNSDEEYDASNTQPVRYWRYDIGENSGVIDSKGNVIIPAIYYNVSLINGNMFEIEITQWGERFLVNEKGQYIDKSGF